MFGWLRKRKDDYTLQFPLAVTYLERLKLIVGNPLEDFPTDMKLWGAEMERSAPDLAARYHLTIPQALALQQTLFLMFEVSLGPEFQKKKAPNTNEGWVAIHELKEIRDLPTEHLLMLVVDRVGCYTSHLLACGGESHVFLPDVSGLVALYHKMNGAAFFLAHNHPNDLPYASDGDIIVARSLKRALEGTGVEFQDSLIVTPDAGWYSLKENGHF